MSIFNALPYLSYLSYLFRSCARARTMAGGLM